MGETKKDFVLTLSCRDQRGLVAAIANFLSAQGANIAESEQYSDPTTEQFHMRVTFTASLDMSEESFSEHFKTIALAYGMTWQVYDRARKPRVMIMVSKMGHCLNDLLYRHSVGNVPMELACVVSNHETYRKRVEDEGYAFHHMPINAETKAEQEAELLALIEREQIDLVILARYMQVLSDEMSQKLAGKVINIHHSFLPSFKGARPYHRAYARGVKLIGATAHYVTADLDEGPIIEQDVSRVDHAMTAEEFVAIGRDIECRVLARAVKAHLEYRLLLSGDRTVVFR